MLHQKKRVSLTLSFNPSQPVLNKDHKIVSIVDRDKNKELIRERLFQLEQFRKEQLTLMKNRKRRNITKPIKRTGKSSEDSSDLEMEIKPIKKQIKTKKILTTPSIKDISGPTNYSRKTLRTPNISTTKLDFDPELPVASAMIDKKIDHIVNMSKMLALKVQRLAEVGPEEEYVNEAPGIAIENSNDECDNSLMESEFISKFDASISSASNVKIKNINYSSNISTKSVVQVLQAKKVVVSQNKPAKKKFDELPHSTSVSDLGSIPDEIMIENLPPLPKPYKQDQFYLKTKEKDYLHTIKNDEEDNLKSNPSLTNIYYDLYSPISETVSQMPIVKTPEVSSYNAEISSINNLDPKNMIISGLESLLKYELRSAKSSDEILALLKTILETKKLVHEFTAPEVSEFTQTDSEIESSATIESFKFPASAKIKHFSKSGNNSPLSSKNSSPSSSMIRKKKANQVVVYYDDFETDISASQVDQNTSPINDSFIEEISNVLISEEENLDETEAKRNSSISNLIKAGEELSGIVRNHSFDEDEIKRNDSIKALIRASESLSNELTVSSINNFSGNKTHESMKESSKEHAGIINFKKYDSPKASSEFSSVAESVSEQIDSLISAALDISKINAGSNTSSLSTESDKNKSDLYKSDFESATRSKSNGILELTSSASTTSTSIIKERVSKLNIEVESKINELQNIKEQKEQQRKERKKKMRDQESQLKDRLAQIEDTIADMLNGDFKEETENLYQADPTVFEKREEKVELDVFEVEKSIENIVENVFLSASREISQNNSITTSSKSSTPQRSIEVENSLQELIDDPPLLEEVCEGIFYSILEEALTDMLYTSYQVKEIIVTFDPQSLFNIIDLALQDLPDQLTRKAIPKISDAYKLSGVEIRLVLDLLQESYDTIWTNFKSTTVPKERFAREMKKKMESWVTYKSDEFFDEVLMDEVKLEEKTWEQFSIEKEIAIDHFTDAVFNNVLQDSLNAMINTNLLR